MIIKGKTNIIVQLSLLGIVLLAVAINYIFGNSMSDIFATYYFLFLPNLIIAVIAVLCFYSPITGITLNILFIGITILSAFLQNSLSNLTSIEYIEFFTTPVCILLFALLPLIKKLFHKPIISYYLIFVIYLVTQIVLNFKNYDNFSVAIFNMSNLFTFLIAILLPIVLFFTEGWYKITPSKNKKTYI